MNIFPAIDLYEGKVVRLLRGDYRQKTVYSDDPAGFAREFQDAGAAYLHLVDLEGAKDGTTPNFSVVAQIARQCSMKVEIGGGIRDLQTVEKYLNAGVWRVILGTAAVTQPGFVRSLVERFGSEHIAVGVDIRDGAVAIKGWLQTTEKSCFDFCEEMFRDGVRGIICTDISRDGAMQGTNRDLYRELQQRFAQIDFVASGGVSDMADITALRDMGLFGAIVGKALYTGDIDLKQAIDACRQTA